MRRYNLFIVSALTFLLFFLSATIQAQTTAFKGIILDAESRKSLPMAQVIVRMTTDSSIVSQVLSDVDGRFSKEVRPGIYLFEYRYVGYEKRIDTVTIFEGTEQDLGTILLKPEAVDLDALVVQAAKDAIEIQPDKKVILVDRLQNVAGGSLAEVLVNLPGITADQDGRISIRGSDRIRILVDGRETALAGEGGADFFQQIPAESIERVEIITNPSARYDAMASMGIINIVLKKNAGDRTSGSITMTGAYEQDHALTGFVRGSKKDIRWDATAGLRFNRTENLHTISRQDFTGANAANIDQRRVYARDGYLQNYGLGAEKVWNSVHSTQIRGNAQLSNRFRDDQTRYRFIDEAANYDYGIDTREDKTGTELSLSHTAKTDKHDFSALYALSNTVETNRMDAVLGGLAAFSDGLDLIQRQRIGERMHVAQTDYTLRASSSLNVSTGLKFTDRSIDSYYRLSNVAPGTVIDPFILPPSSEYAYEESIFAGYLLAQYSFNKTMVELGARGQHTELRLPGSGGLAFANGQNERSFRNVFWSGQIVHQFNDFEQFRVSYNQRLNLPSVSQLNPNVAFKDLLNIRRGNALLQPEFSEKVEAGYSIIGKKQQFEISVYRLWTSDVIQRLREIDAQGVVFETFGNLASEVNTGFEFIGSQQWLPFWKLELSINGFYVQTDGQNLNPNFERDYFASFSLISNNFTLPDKSQLQITHFYASPLFTVQGKMAPLQNVDLSWRKDFGTAHSLTLRAADIFDTRRFDFITDTNELFLDNRYKRLTRRAYISYAYRFNNYKASSKKKKIGDGIEELKDF